MAGSLMSNERTGMSSLPYVMASLPPLFWAGNFVVARFFHEEIPPFQMSFWRWVIALAILLAWAAPLMRGQRETILAEWPRLALLGLIGVTGFNCLIYLGLGHTTVVNGALINAMMPVVTFFFAALLIGERVHGRQIAGLILCIVGVATIAARGEPGRLVQLGFDRGDLLILTGVLCWALYTVMIRWKPTGLPLPVFLAVTTLFGVLFHLPFVVWEAGQTTMTVTSANLLALLYLGIFPSLLAYILWARAVAALGPGKAGMFMYLMPLFSTVMAVLLLGEQLRLFHGVGALLIFAGIVIVTRRQAAAVKTAT
jgi:drug/metabolite transporter (DMT)-like permease